MLLLAWRIKAKGIATEVAPTGGNAGAGFDDVPGLTVGAALAAMLLLAWRIKAKRHRDWSRSYRVPMLARVSMTSPASL